MNSESPKNKRRRDEYVYALRQLADFLEGNPGLPLPNENQFLCPQHDKADFVRAVKLIGSHGRKSFTGDSFANYEVQFGPLTYEVYIAREKVCRRIVKGVEQVPAKPAHDREIVEWECEPWLENV